MARALTVQNAEINTASITIRTLQVEGRQVTMGVFRQLPVEDIIELEGPHLKGVGWGHVNYQVEGHYAYSGKTIHLIWQQGNELRRCLVHQTRNRPNFSFPDYRKMPANADEEIIKRWRSYAEQNPDRDDYMRTANGYQRDRDDWLMGQERWRAERAAAYENHQQLLGWIHARDALVVPLFYLPQLFIAV